MINLKRPDELTKLKLCGKVNAIVKRELAHALEPGITTKDLDELAAEVMRSHGASSSITELGFPGSICISLNDEVGHGVPSNYVIQEGDLVKLDVAVELAGYHTDSATSLIVGKAPEQTHQLVKATQAALEAGIRAATPGKHCSDISATVFNKVKEHGYSVIRKAFGHGIGTELHEDPQIANFGPPNMGPKLRPGMVLAIEPLVSTGNGFAYRTANGWADITSDHSLAAHFEDTIVITEVGPEVITRLSKGDEVSFTLAAGKGPKESSRRAGLKPIEKEVQREDIVFRPMKEGEQAILFKMAAKEMDPILMEAWGRRADPREVFSPEAEVVVLETVGGEVAGFYTTSIHSHGIHLNTLVIDNSFQGHGLGRRTVAHIIEVSQRRNLQKVTLHVQTNNQRAIHLYEKLGFQNRGLVEINTLLMERVNPPQKKSRQQ